LEHSAAFFVCAVISLCAARSRIWRDLVLIICLGACALVSSGRFPSLFAAGLMPVAAVAAISLGIPGNGIRRRKKIAAHLCQALRAVAALTAFVLLIRHSGLNVEAPGFGAVIAVAAVVISLGMRAAAVSASRSAKVFLVALYACCALLFPVLLLSGPFPEDMRSLLLGTGLGSADVVSGGERIGARILAEHGLISVALLECLLVGALWTNAARLVRRHSPESQSRDVVDEDRDILSAAAVVSLLCLFACAPFSDGFLLARTVPATWGFCLSLAFLGIASRSGQQRAGREARVESVRRCAIRVGAAVALVALICGILRVVTFAYARSPQGAMGRVPAVLAAAATAQSPIKEPADEFQTVLRHALGCRVSVERPSLALLLADRLTGVGGGSSRAAEVGAGLLGLGISHFVPRPQIVRLFLETLDYGVPPSVAARKGPAEAAGYYFHKSLDDITPTEARFLTAARYRARMPEFRFATSGAAPRLEPLGVRSFRCDELPMPVKDSVWIHHEGSLDSHGQVAAIDVGPDGVFHPFVSRSGKERLLSTIPDEGGYVVGMNDAGEAVGWSSGRGGQRAVTWDRLGAIHMLGTLPGYAHSVARGINDRGQIVGYCFNDARRNGAALTEQSHAFLWEQGTMRDLGVAPGCRASRAYAINNVGQVAGWVLTADDKTHAMVWENGAMHDIGALADGTISIATALNDAGQVVGSSDHSDGTVSAFLWQNGVMHDLGMLPGSTHSKAYAINNLGQITGVSISGVDYNGGGQIFVWDCKNGMRDPIALHQVTQPEEGRLTDNCMAFALNDHDQLLGLTYYAQWRRMFLLSPDNRSPDYALMASPAALSVCPGAHAWTTVRITPQGGFADPVHLSASNAPSGLKVAFSPAKAMDASIVTLDASAAAPPGDRIVTLTGSANGIRHAATIKIAVTPERQGCVPLDISAAFNVFGIATDGTASRRGGLDNQGFTYSADLLGRTLFDDGVPFHLGPPDNPNAAHDVTIALPTGRFVEMRILSSAINGRQDNQAFTVEYADGHRSVYRRNVSDWASPSHQPGERIASSMPYRNRNEGARDQYTPVNIYCYQFPLDRSRTVRKLILPPNGNLRVMAVTLIH
jgi:probable HAF family extracellular repeat protein